jgi:hypothetical protein
LVISNIYCGTLKLQIDKIIALINTPDKLNPQERKTRTQTFLEILKFYQDLTTQDILKLQGTTIGYYTGPESLQFTGPSGTDGTITRKEGVAPVSKKENESQIQTKLDEYTKQSKDIDYALTLNDFKFKDINRSILLKLNKKGKLEVLSIFPTDA